MNSDPIIDRILADSFRVRLFGEAIQGLTLEQVVKLWTEFSERRDELMTWAYNEHCKPFKKLADDIIGAKSRANGFVYLMRNNRNGLVKIGYSKNPKFRESTLQSEEPDVEMIFFFKAPRYTEPNLHVAYQNRRVRGEWFRLGESDIQAIKRDWAMEVV